MFLEFGSSDPRGSFPVWELISGINTSNEPTKNMEKKKSVAQLCPTLMIPWTVAL